MTTARSKRFKGKVRDDYLELVMKFPLTSVHSEEDLVAAQEVMDGLLAQRKLSAGQELYLDALSDLVAAYEDEHYRILPASDAEMLRHLMNPEESISPILQNIIAQNLSTHYQ
ncbi:hypothetical protein [Gimesia sp.]|uniref:hypothetical protein n=1 Tax=Gimesia sp. TaxID=2024833 RepID=UPI000C40D763|nr:hypothetical protein [Gimesia sp.]MAX36257.1 hypothetical protein [Gimesia sp.]HAH47900.1 hypothetical protein [Planctomycetaceae bacterium]HBL45932.1 hypothetical protein [Planctomycetaceae bacterium]|tara:strand:- start:835 stop:1173 length:339 start_codon:yes stop_codon:yes gene_type:complete